MNAVAESGRPAVAAVPAAAAAAVAAAAAEERHQYLTFMLGGEAYAAGILRIKEIIEYCSLTEVPMMPPAIRGVINLRGAVVPVLDLALRFGKPATQAGRRTCIVIVEVAGGAEGQPQVMGVLVDAVNAVLEIGRGDIEPPPAFGTRIRSDFIEGMAKVQGRFVIVLDVDKVLSPEDLEGLALAPSAIAAPAEVPAREALR